MFYELVNCHKSQVVVYSYTESVLVTLTLQNSFICFLFGLLEINLIGESLIENTRGQEKLSSSPE